jgi:4-amino-4-deoxy-L-arabinose transferase-like glycosyltransferase
MTRRPINTAPATTYGNRRNALVIAAALAAGLLLRLWFIAHLSQVAGDSLLYGNIAKNLLQHHVYGFTESGPTPGSIMIRPTLIRLPGYPLFLAACFRLFGMENYRAVLYVQLVADLVTCWLIAALAGRLFGRRAAQAALWLGALCPFTANYVATPLTETLVLTTIALAFYAFLRWQQDTARYNRWLGLIAIALSGSILLRPDQGLLAAAVVPAMLWAVLAPKRLTSAVHVATPVLLASLCVLLPLVPWTARNWHTFHLFQPLAPRSAADPGEYQPTGFNRWYRTWAIDFASTADIYWNFNGSRMEIADVPARAFASGCFGFLGIPRESQRLYAETQTAFNAYNQTTTSTPYIDAYFDDLAHERIKANPICYYVALPVARLLDMTLRPRVELFDIESEWWRGRRHPGQILFSVAYAVLNLAYFVLAAIGLRRWRTQNTTYPVWLRLPPLAWAMIGFVVLRSALLLTLDNSEPRYTLEFFPILIVFAAAIFATHPPNTTSDCQP